MSGPEAGGDHDDPRPRPLLGPMFWTALAFAALCVAGGVALAAFGGRPA